MFQILIEPGNLKLDKKKVGKTLIFIILVMLIKVKNKQCTSFVFDC